MDWWDDLLPARTWVKQPGAELMLRVLAYDIAGSNRRRRAAAICLDYGVRVQKSMFECWLDDDRFESLWLELAATIDADTDKVLAYTLDSKAARERRTTGDQMDLTRKMAWYVL